MVHEAFKTNKLRTEEFRRTYLAGKILDIGAGGAPVTSSAISFDKAQGDAQHASDHFPRGSFDCVHSSHCLEHMKDVPAAFQDWWKLVKPNGYLVLVVPDEDLYEQGAWPSLFNPDHKATFRLGGGPGWSPVSYEITQLVKTLPGAALLSLRRIDEGYDYNYQAKGFSRNQRQAYKFLRLPLCVLQYLMGKLAPLLYPLMKRLNLPIDQTMGPALAQIEVVLQKSSNAA